MLLFYFSPANCQGEITVTLLDGTEVTGPGKFGSIRAVIWSEDGEKKIFNHKNAKRVEYKFTHPYPGVAIYEWKKIKSLSRIPWTYLLEVQVDGEIQLLATEGTEVRRNWATSGDSFTKSGMPTYYISKKGEEWTYKIQTYRIYSPKFRQIAKAFFSDCSEFMRKYEAKEIRFGLKTAVRFYNNNCN